MHDQPIPTTETIGFGGGCHWCTEAVFQALRGVVRVDQGWAASRPPDDARSEAIVVHFDPAKITLKTLIAVHLHTHSCTGKHALRTRYRSAVYISNASQQHSAVASIAELAADFDAPIATRVLSLEQFELNDPKYLNYYRTRPDSAFCQTYVHPKLAKIRRQFAAHVLA